MATRSMIAQMDENGVTAKAVYCHWDGYLSNNGHILQTHYNSVKTRELIQLGDLSSLQAEIGTAHPFSRLECNLNTEEWEAQYGNQCTFYGRDRGLYRTSFHIYDSFAKLIDAAEDCGGQFVYILRGEEWFYSKKQYSGGWTALESLSQALEFDRLLEQALTADNEEG